MGKALFHLGLLAALVRPAAAGDWPHWRGPEFNGAAAEQNLPITWSATENLLWRQELPGPGAATPVVRGDRVFVSSADRNSAALFALCFDLRNGQLLWKHQAAVAERTPPSNTMAAPSPVTDGKRTVFLYGTGDLLAFDVNGKVLWHRNLERDFGPLFLKYGYSSSPLLLHNRLIVQVLQNEKPYPWNGDSRGPSDSFLLAMDAQTGKDLWKRERRLGASGENQDAYSSPVPFQFQNRTVVVVAGSDHVTAHEPETGREIWRFCYNPSSRPAWRLVASPVPGPDLVFGVTPRGRNPLFAIPGNSSGTLSWEQLAWVWREGDQGPKPETPDVCVPLLYQGRLYVLGDTSNTLSCLDAERGQVLWQAHLPRGQPYRASPLGVDGRVYCVNEAGVVTVFRAADSPQELGRFHIGEAPVQASFVAASNRIFVRTGRALWCVGRQLQM